MSDEITKKLAEAGVFKGSEGLEGLANAKEFWEQQAYSTRLYYGPGIADYLHRDVLIAAIEVLKEPDLTERVRELERQMEAVRDLAIFLAKAHMEWHSLRWQAVALPPEECLEFLTMQFPTIQGTSNQFDLEKVGASSYDKANIRKAVDLLLNKGATQ